VISINIQWHALIKNQNNGFVICAENNFTFSFYPMYVM